jgi:hypothetical protein
VQRLTGHSISEAGQCVETTIATAEAVAIFVCGGK